MGPSSCAIYPHWRKFIQIGENVSPALLVQFLREHRTEWADFRVDAHSAALLKAGSCAFSGSGSSHFSDTGMLLGLTVNNDEILEIIRLEDHALHRKDAFLQNIYLLQLCNGVEENSVGVCSELIFAPIEERLPHDAVLLSSGFRILSLGSSRVSEKYSILCSISSAS
ncbi:unnamed protein product [Ilex paraguariensis]|uniref:Uncharacterized protein n=1 Tax=Ilex paraguariensis TaxID=185542 RepID=A0ABC8TP14_9AQUA